MMTSWLRSRAARAAYVLSVGLSISGAAQAGSAENERKAKAYCDEQKAAGKECYVRRSKAFGSCKKGWTGGPKFQGKGKDYRVCLRSKRHVAGEKNKADAERYCRSKPTGSCKVVKGGKLANPCGKGWRKDKPFRGKGKDYIACVRMKKKERTAIFEDYCGGRRVSTKNSLSAACKAHDGKILAKCTYKCVDKKGLKCKRRGWKLKKAMSCEQGAKKLKMVGCSLDQMRKLETAHTIARSEIRRLDADIEAAIRGRAKGKTTRRLKASLKQVRKITKALDKKIRVACKGDSKKKCANRIPAYTYRVVGQGFKTCPTYYEGNTTDNDIWRAQVMVHELAHKGIKFWGDPNHYRPPDPKKAWHTTAFTYEYWLANGFCIPGETCSN